VNRFHVECGRRLNNGPTFSPVGRATVGFRGTQGRKCAFKNRCQADRARSMPQYRGYKLSSVVRDDIVIVRPSQLIRCGRRAAAHWADRPRLPLQPPSAQDNPSCPESDRAVVPAQAMPSSSMREPRTQPQSQTVRPASAFGRPPLCRIRWNSILPPMRSTRSSDACASYRYIERDDRTLC